MKAFMGVCLLLLVALSSGAVLDRNKNDRSATRALTYIGEFGNKKYYVESNPVTWQTGQSLCRAQSMLGLSIESQAELAYLNGVLPDSQGHWTSGQSRSQPEPEEFYWINVPDYRDYVRFDFNFSWNRFSFAPPSECLAIKQQSGNPGWFESALCGDLKPVLCQLTMNN